MLGTIISIGGYVIGTLLGRLGYETYYGKRIKEFENSYFEALERLKRQNQNQNSD